MPHGTSNRDFYAKRFAKQENIVARRIVDELVLVPIRSQASEVDGIYSLNKVAAWIWELVDGERPVSEILDAVVATFEVDVQTAEQDIEELFEQLVTIGAIGEAP